MKQFIRIVLLVMFTLLSKDLVGQSHGWTVNPADYGNTGTITGVVSHGTVGVSSGTLGAFVGGVCRGYINCSLFIPTGKYVFVLTVYSNAASGETLTFKYFDPSNNAYFDINETETFSSDMILGDAMSPIQFHTKPLVYSVTGGGSYCEGASGLPVGLSSTETGVTYTLLKNGSALSPTVAGTGSAISFDNQLAGTYTVTGTNSGGTITMAGNAIIIENPLPLIPIANPGSGATCSQITSNWASSSYATSYVLDVSAVNDFATYLNGYQNINVGNVTTYPVSGLSPGTIYYYRVRAVNSCGTSASSSVISYSTSPAAPSQPGTITGAAAQCPALALQTYSISSVPNATIYTWTVPAGWSITAGQGTTSISVTTGTTGQNGSITVNAGNSCGTSAANSLALTVSPGTPAVPGAIAGTSIQCPGLALQTYSITSVANATTYTWAVPTGWSITAGQGTTSISVTTGTTGQNGSITVNAGNSCGTSTANSHAVTVSPGTPVVPGAITGTSAQCPGLTLQTYSITSVANATTYTWAVPTGWSITSGQGATSISVTTGNTGQNGSITVNAGNSCGTSTANSLAVTISPGTPAVPGAITGTTIQCPGLTGQIYSISSVPNATTYTWTVPTGWSITAGQGTTTVTVTTGSAGQNGNITVYAGNSCGTSGSGTLPLSVNANPTITGQLNICMGSATNLIGSGTPAASSPWTSASPSVAQISNAGFVSTINPGTSIITYTDNFGCKNNTTVTVNSLPVITGTLSIFLGSSTQLTGSGVPSPSSPWVSSAPAVATVSNTGLINSVVAGTSIITYTDINGCSSSVTVTIKLVNLNKPLAAGWNWFSVNTLLSNMSLTNVLPAVTSDGDYIKNQTSTATYYSGFGWFGSLTEIDPTKLYKIKVQNASSISFSGAPVNINLTSIGLVTGWNWIGYLPQSAQTIGNALSSLSLTDGDYIKNQTASTTYYTSVGWFGSLNQLSPNDGFMIKLTIPGTLKYSDVQSKNASEISAGVSESLINPAEYEFSGSVTAKIIMDGNNAGSIHDTLFTYVNNQLRGYSASYFFQPLGIYLFPVMTFSNRSDGENIEFRYYSSLDNKIYTCNESLPFVKDMIISDAFHPLVLTVNSGLTYNSEPTNNTSISLKAYPNPFDGYLKIEFTVNEQSFVQLEVCTSSGKIIRVLVNEELSPDGYSIDLDSSLMPEGLYIIKLMTGSKQETQKVMLVK